MKTKETEQSPLVIALDHLGQVDKDLFRIEAGLVAHRTALAILMRHVAARGAAQLDTLARDMDVMSVQMSEQSVPECAQELVEIAKALRLMHEGMTSPRKRVRRPRGE
jgi:hypothetical protein